MRILLHCIFLIASGFICIYLVPKADSSQITRFLSKYPSKQDKPHSENDPNTDQYNYNANEIVIRRHKRSVIQLAMLLQEGIKYNVEKLLNYGNYCGIGSDRAGDGSVIDKCDECCKSHDSCYDETMYSNNSSDLPSNDIPDPLGLVNTFRQLNCVPYFLTYRIANISEENPYCIIDKTVSFGKLEETNCAPKICECDLQLVRCLQKEPCPLF